MKKVMINDLAKQLASKANLTQKRSKELINLTFELISDELTNDNEVLISNFGKFKTINVNREETVLKQEQYKIRASKTVSFSSAKKFNQYFRRVNHE
ncbi:hypothetical protein SSYRP_v1c04630 [Spiroplasma syrphidicola EA-1]|uniref:DNA-binding protein HU-beta n=1 Tax=Spiroplasma syrphidicola EA-1 TaxID=1276229 RepID=R4UIR8_9MOLU|nr:HU family DNA-binding protein [Spiroplasma syrphidicola]AGM26055.1 hypothetical protein SSYRP_v1c04630 [Spiroplasma syrphidicola EA-1]